jgi:hypothetical protein
MSLGIVAIENSEVLLMADTQLTFPEHSGKKPLFGLKVSFLDSNTAIAYAGAGPEVAHGRVYGIYKQGHRGDLDILAQQIHSSFDRKVDFLLARTGTEPSIAKVANGQIAFQSGKGVFWVGDANAAHFVADSTTYSLYQLQDGLSKAIDDPRFPTVGGHCVVARGTTHGFRFVAHMKLVSPPCRQCSPGGMGWQPVNFGTAETGGFGYTTIVPKQAGTNGWGVFYFQGRFGKYWHVDLETDMCEILKAHAQNVMDFVKLIQDETGVELEYGGSIG